MRSVLIVEHPEIADMVFSDTAEGDNVVHSCDIDKLITLINVTKRK